jgi:RimJ/RimL family protein N-acetyltransferase
MYPVALTGTTVRLREFDLTDVDVAADIVGDPQVTDWLSFDAKSYDQTTDMIKGIVGRAKADHRTEYYLAVTCLDSTDLIGFARLGLTGAKAAKLGFAVRANKWGQGYATDAARTLITFGFTRLGLHRISAAVGPENKASTALVTKLGFKFEGILRDHVFTNNAWRDSVLYSILESEWALPQSPSGQIATTTLAKTPPGAHC